MKTTAGRLGWIVAAIFSAGCGFAGRAEPRTIVIVQAEGLRSLEPYESNEDHSANILGNVFEPLIAMDANLKLVPALAESWYTPDATTWVFRLRKGAVWHDGAAVTPFEVIASLERARSDPKSRRRPELSQVTAMTPGGVGEVVLKTRAPFGALASQIAQVPVSRAGAGATSFPVGTGPYRLETFTPGGDTQLVPARPGQRLHPLLFRVMPDPATRLRMLIEGRADILPYLTAEAAAAVSRSANARPLRRRGLLIAFLSMDYARLQTPYVSVKTNPFRDHRVRLAIASVIDRETLVAEALQGNGSPLAQMVVPEAFGYAPDAPHPSPDLTAARALMAEAGFGSGFEVTLDFEGAADSRSPVVEVLSRQVAQIGIRIKPRPHATQDLLPRVEARDTSFYLLSWVGTSGDLGSTAEFLLRTPSEGRGTDNGGGYSSQETDALLDAAAATLDAEARLSLLRKVEERIRLDVPVIPLLRREDLYGVAAGVSFDLRLDREIRGATLVVGPR